MRGIGRSGRFSSLKQALYAIQTRPAQRLSLLDNTTFSPHCSRNRFYRRVLIEVELPKMLAWVGSLFKYEMYGVLPYIWDWRGISFCALPLRKVLTSPTSHLERRRTRIRLADFVLGAQSNPSRLVVAQNSSQFWRLSAPNGKAFFAAPPGIRQYRPLCYNVSRLTPCPHYRFSLPSLISLMTDLS